MPKKKKKRTVRQITVICKNEYAEFREMDLIPLFDSPRGLRADPAQESTVIQKNLNDKNSKRLFYQKAINNFGPCDCMLTLEYKDKYLPLNLVDAEKELTNYLRRVRDRMKKKSCGPLKYLAVTEYTIRKSGKHKGKFHVHHHVLISGDLGRDELEAIWRRPPRKGKKEGELIGYPSSKPLYFDENGIEGLMVYFFGEEKASAQTDIGITREKNKRRWRGSKNLKEPKRPKPNDTRWSDKQISDIAKDMQENGGADPAFWEKQYPGYKFSKCAAEYNQFTGRWSIYLRMHRRL